MSGFLQGLIDNYQAHLDRARNRPFLEGAMAACAMVATVDGEVSFAERVRVDQILGTLERLQGFDEGIDIFNEFTDAILKNCWKATNAPSERWRRSPSHPTTAP
ncbi:MAG: hypothetical protein VW405_05925 [Rhodospirillaceae bacterium]